MKKVLFFETPEFTGATRVTRTIAKEYQDCYLVFFVTVAPDEDAQLNISKAIDYYQPNIVFCSFISINSYVILEGKRRDLIVIIRNDYKLEDVDSEVRNRAKETYHLANIIIAQNETLRKELINEFRLNPDIVNVRRNPVDKAEIDKALMSAKSPYPDNRCKHYVWVGRFSPIKNIPFLMEAFGIAHSVNPKSELYLIGEPDTPQKYRQSGVHIIGFQNNPYPWIKFSECLILCSHSEACPNVLLEALYIGTKVITTEEILRESSICNKLAFTYTKDDARSLANMMLQQ